MNVSIPMHVCTENQCEKIIPNDASDLGTMIAPVLFCF